MNLIDAYRYLAALEQHRHFGRAALACHITQPALSNAMRALEAHLNVAIVRRGRQYEGLTPEGEQVLATAHRVLREQESLQQSLAGSAEQPRGALVIGAVPTAVPIAARFAARLVERHPGIVPQVRSLSSQEIETGLDTLALDLGLGYTERLDSARSSTPQAWPQYVEHYHLLRRVAHGGRTLHFGVPLRWSDAAALPLCMLSPDMHNRAILDRVFHALGLVVQPVIETNSVMALLAAVQASQLVAVLPGALVSTVTGQPGLEALPLVEPDLRTPIGFMSAPAARPSHALAAALRLVADPAWLAEVATHSGPLRPPAPAGFDHEGE
jgi:DNA-binding transcriptional LysR family regulator